ncbi:MAG: SDR family oxidoreductase [Leptospiraceae bacterium]|nr:SDR family oxidoreductase [Leptospiraceae bacterium]
MNVLVIGGTGGIGLGILEELSANNDSFHFTYRNETKAKLIAERLKPKSIHFLDYENEPVKTLEEILNKIEIPDLIILAAGTAYYGSFESMNEKDIHHVLEVDLNIPILLTNFLVKKMKEKGSGHIHIVSAIAGLLPAVKNMAVYTAAKFGLIGFVRSVSMELLGTNVKLSVSAPAGVITGLVENSSGDKENFEKVIGPLRKNFDSIQSVGKGILNKLEQREPVILPTDSSLKFFESSKDRRFWN